MATTNTVETENTNQQLKHLEFVKVAALNTLVCVSSLYEYAKQKSGPLRSGVQTVEGTVTTVVGPVFEKFKDVPHHLLVFLDEKVDVATNKFDQHAPPVAKKAASRALSMVQKASELTQRIVSEAQTKGVTAAASFAVKKSEHYLSEQTVKAWWTLNRVPPFQMVAQVTVPRAAQLSDKYNQVVTNMTQQGYTVFSYLPLVPVDKIAEAFKRGEVAKEDTQQLPNGGGDTVASETSSSD
ncbi:Rubber elongation factor [Macleaya cordata]|uniref:Rubber elongation factor n=1 Tax=Macleaya cordata TaxID=56857 RepID=A0A200R444_MACCD|nr:Rubber elongation factor [Macleaya cordata]